jgi:hypothetical protein
MHAVVEVIPIAVADINVVGGIPVWRPVSRPRINHHERIAAVLEARVTRNYDGLALNAKPVPRAEIEAETIFRNVIAAISAALPPSAVIGLPV